MQTSENQKPKAQESLLVISAIASSRPGIAHDISDLVAECGCNIRESKMKVMGGTFNLVLMASGCWNAIAKLEHTLPTKACALGMTTMIKRTDDVATRPDRLPYRVSIIALDKVGMTREITAFFAEQDINIREMNSDTYIAPHSSAPVAEIRLTVGVSTKIQISDLREKFERLCKKLNLDASLEPITR